MLLKSMEKFIFNRLTDTIKGVLIVVITQYVVCFLKGISMRRTEGLLR